jgi:protein-S-isoprenylcysteine O-methyltransferase Ste14
MEWISSHPLTTLAIILAIAAPIVGWLVFRRLTPTSQHPRTRTAIRMSYVSGVILMILGVGRTVLNVIEGRFPPDIFLFLGLLLIWIGWTASRSTARTNSTSHS